MRDERADPPRPGKPATPPDEPTEPKRPKPEDLPSQGRPAPTDGADERSRVPLAEARNARDHESR